MNVIYIIRGDLNNIIILLNMHTDVKFKYECM